MPSYTPRDDIATLLARAYQYVRSVPYQVSLRWVFYRLLQDGWVSTKADYVRVKGILSKARKQFYEGWTPDILADDTRAAIIRGDGFQSSTAWVEGLGKMHCELDHWANQPSYVEVWFEAAAMQGQFRFYTDPNISLLAFHGDVSIPEKWKAATRLLTRWLRDRKPIFVLYYGDLDPKGEQIPETAYKDIIRFVGLALQTQHNMPYDDHLKETFWAFQDDFTFRRVGINLEHVTQYSIPENPDHPATYQWEALADAAVQQLINEANLLLDPVALEILNEKEGKVTARFLAHLASLDVADLDTVG